MRIAVLIYGRLNKCVEHYDNTIEHLGKHNEIDFFLSSDNSSESLLNDFINLYKPISYNNDPIHYECRLGKYPGKRRSTNIHNMTCHFINKNRVFVLLENYINKMNIQYDVVVSLRIDIIYYTSFNFNNLADNTIYIPEGRDFINKAMNDQIAYGKVDVMKKYNYINPTYLLEKKLSIPHPESLNFANIRFKKLRVKRFDMKWIIDR
jgi:hypothetical protein